MGKMRASMLRHGECSVIGCAVDVDSGCVHFYIDGKPFAEGSLVFEGIHFCAGLTPVVNVEYMTGQEMTVCFGNDVKHLPEGYRPMQEAIDHLDALHTPEFAEKPIPRQTSKVELRARSGADFVAIEEIEGGSYRARATGYLPSVAASGVRLHEGCWYYEATLERIGGHGHSYTYQPQYAQTENWPPRSSQEQSGGNGTIGWADSRFTGDFSAFCGGDSGDDSHNADAQYKAGAGVGDDRFSWGYAGCLPSTIPTKSSPEKHSGRDWSAIEQEAATGQLRAAYRHRCAPSAGSHQPREIGWHAPFLVSLKGESSLIKADSTEGDFSDCALLHPLVEGSVACIGGETRALKLEGGTITKGGTITAGLPIRSARLESAREKTPARTMKKKPCTIMPPSHAAPSWSHEEGSNVLCCALDVDKGHTFFALNKPIDLSQPPAHEGVKGMRGTGLMPAASLHSNMVVRFNFGPNFKFKRPEGYQAVSESLSKARSESSDGASKNAASAPSFRNSSAPSFRKRADVTKRAATSQQRNLQQKQMLGSLTAARDLAEVPAIRQVCNFLLNSIRLTASPTASSSSFEGITDQERSTFEKGHVRLGSRNIEDKDVFLLLKILQQCEHSSDQWKCTELVLAHNAVGLQGIHRIGLYLENTSHLCSLDLNGLSLGAQGAEVLAQALAYNESLTKLDLSHCFTGGAVAPVAVALGSHPGMRVLRLCGNRLGEEGAAAVAELLQCESSARRIGIQTLDLSQNELGEKGMKKLAPALRTNRTLTTIDLSENHMGKVGALELAAALGSGCDGTEFPACSSVLQQLVIGEQNVVGDDGAAELSEQICSNLFLPLQYLELQDTRVTSRAQVSLSFTLLKKRSRPVLHLNLLPLLEVRGVKQCREYTQRPLCFAIKHGFHILAQHLVDAYNAGRAERISLEEDIMAEQIDADAAEALRLAIAYRACTISENRAMSFTEDIEACHCSRCRSRLTENAGDEGKCSTAPFAIQWDSDALLGLIQAMVGGGPLEGRGVHVDTLENVQCVSREHHPVDNVRVQVAMDIWGCGKMELIPMRVAMRVMAARQHAGLAAERAVAQVAGSAGEGEWPFPTLEHELAKDMRLTALLLALFLDDGVVAQIIVQHNRAHECILQDPLNQEHTILYDAQVADAASPLSGTTYRKHCDFCGIAVHDLPSAREQRLREALPAVFRSASAHEQPALTDDQSSPPSKEGQVDVAEPKTKDQTKLSKSGLALFQKKSVAQPTTHRQCSRLVRAGATAIRLAARQGMDDVVEQLLREGEFEEDENWLGCRGSDGTFLVDQYSGRSALHDACCAKPKFLMDGSDQIEATHIVAFIKRLLALRTKDPAQQVSSPLLWYSDRCLRLPLHYACALGNEAVVAILLQEMSKEATPGEMSKPPIEVALGVMDGFGWEPLALAAYNCHVGCVRMLLDAGACPLQTRTDKLRRQFTKPTTATAFEHAAYGAQQQLLMSASSGLESLGFRTFLTRVCKNRMPRVPGPYVIALLRLRGEQERVLLQTNRGSIGTADAPQEESLKLLADSLECARQQVKVLSEIPTVSRYRLKFICWFLFSEGAMYLVFVILLIKVALYSTTGQDNAFVGYQRPRIFRTHVADVVLNLEPFATSFNDISSADDLSEFVSGPLYNFLWSENGGTKDGLVGAVRFRQVRARAMPCVNTGTWPPSWAKPLLQSLGSSQGQCYATESEESAGFVTPSNSTFVYTGDASSSPWTANRFQKFSCSSIGDFQCYPSGGYVLDVPAGNATIAERNLTALHDWVDVSTRAVFIDFALLNWNTHFLQVVHLMVEFPPSGGAFPKSYFLPIAWPKYWNIFQDRTAALLECLLYVWVGYGSYQEVTEVIDNRKKYIDDRWNIYDVFVLGLVAFWGSLRLRFYSTVPSLHEGPPSQELYIDFQQVAMLFQMQRDVLAFAVMMATLKLQKYLRLLPLFGPMIQASSAAIVNTKVLVYLVFFVFFVSCVAVGCYVAFAAGVAGYESLPEAALTTFLGFLTSNAPRTEMQHSSYWFGLVAFFMIVIVGGAVLTNIFIAVSGAAYSDAVAASEQGWQDNVNDLLIKRLHWGLMRGDQLLHHPDGRPDDASSNASATPPLDGDVRPGNEPVECAFHCTWENPAQLGSVVVASSLTTSAEKARRKHLRQQDQALDQLRQSVLRIEEALGRTQKHKQK
jgi:hypothetical protein